MRIRYILFLLLLVSSPFLVAGTGSSYKFLRLSPSGGLSVDGIKTIVQDNEGFIWVQTSDELFRFDGYNFQSYSQKIRISDDKFPIIYNHILFSKKQNRLFLATNRGVFAYDALHATFEYLLSGVTEKMYENRQTGILYLVGPHLRTYNLVTRTLEELDIRISQCTCSTDGQFFVIYGKNLLRLEGDQKLVAVYSFPDEQNFVSLQCVGKELWMLSETQGLFCWNIEKQRITRQLNSFLSSVSKDVPAKCMYIEPDRSCIWVGTQQGLYLLDVEDDTFRYFTRDYSNRYGLINSSIWTLFKDVQGGMWIGTYAGGINYLSSESNRGFHGYSLASFKITPRPISAFAQDEEGLWLGTEGGGLYKFQEGKGITASFCHQEKKNSLKYDYVKTLLNDTNGNLWIGMYRGGVDCYNPRTKQFKNYSARDARQRILSDEVYKFVAEADSGMWVIYQSSQTVLTYFPFNRNHSEHHFFDKSNIYKENRLTGICRDSIGYLWLSTYNNLFRFDIRKKQMETISIPGEKISYIRSLYFEESERALWLGTQNQGLIRYQVDRKEFQFFDFYPQFGNLTVNSLTSDLSGNLWLGSNHGLYRLSKKDNSFSKYDENDNLQGMVLYPNAVFKESNGNIYFGGTEGFTRIIPDSIQVNKFKPKVLIADIRLNSQSVYAQPENEELTWKFADEKKMILSYQQNSIEIELAANNYLLPLKNRYKYRLCGFDEKWKEVDAYRRYVSYPKLPKGNYRFEAMASNNDGVWGEPFTLEFTVCPAPWQSWWAYACYVAFFSLLLYAFYRNRMRKLQYKNEKYKAELHEQEQEKAHQAKLQFFTNITHDFKTPLTMILGMLDSMEEDKVDVPSFYMDALKSNSRRLLKLVNEVIDFRMVENDVMKPDIRMNNLNQLIRSCVSEVWGYAFKKSITLQIGSESTLPDLLPFDKQIMEKIVVNLLDNSLKYTASNGKVQIHVYADVNSFTPEFANSCSEGKQEKQKKYWGVSVKDTGVGISAESISEVFIRFFRTNESKGEQHLGSGIGLALVKSLVLVHNGFILIYSERNKGTELLVAFPYLDDQATSQTLPENESMQVVLEKQDAQREEIDFIPFQSSFETTSKPRILLAEDNEELRELIKRRLCRNYDIVEAQDGEQALYLLGSNSIDLILSDWMMPHIDGIALCTQVKKNPQLAHIPFILMTVRNREYDRFEGYNAGAEVYIEKPVDFKLLASQINNLLSLREHFRKHYSENYFIDAPKELCTEEQNELMNKMTEILKRDIASTDMNVEDMAKELLISRRKLLTVVKECTGKSIVEYIRSYKMHYALHLFVKEGVSVKELPQKIGMESASYFTKAFKKEFGATPSAMLKKIKNKETLQTNSDKE